MALPISLIKRQYWKQIIYNTQNSNVENHKKRSNFRTCYENMGVMWSNQLKLEKGYKPKTLTKNILSGITEENKKIFWKASEMR